MLLMMIHVSAETVSTLWIGARTECSSERSEVGWDEEACTSPVQSIDGAMKPLLGNYGTRL